MRENSNFGGRKRGLWGLKVGHCPEIEGEDARVEQRLQEMGMGWHESLTDLFLPSMRREATWCSGEAGRGWERWQALGRALVCGLGNNSTWAREIGRSHALATVAPHPLSTISFQTAGFFSPLKKGPLPFSVHRNKGPGRGSIFPKLTMFAFSNGIANGAKFSQQGNLGKGHTMFFEFLYFQLFHQFEIISRPKY